MIAVFATLAIITLVAFSFAVGFVRGHGVGFDDGLDVAKKLQENK